VTDMGAIPPLATPRPVCLAPWPCLGLINCPPKHACLLCVCVSKQTDGIFVPSVPSQKKPCVYATGLLLRSNRWGPSWATDTGGLFHPSPCVSCAMAMPWTHRLPPMAHACLLCVCVCQNKQTAFSFVVCVCGGPSLPLPSLPTVTFACFCPWAGGVVCTFSCPLPSPPLTRAPPSLCGAPIPPACRLLTPARPRAPCVRVIISVVRPPLPTRW
jgi:hypothetical protein